MIEPRPMRMRRATPEEGFGGVHVGAALAGCAGRDSGALSGVGGGNVSMATPPIRSRVDFLGHGVRGDPLRTLTWATLIVLGALVAHADNVRVVVTFVRATTVEALLASSASSFAERVESRTRSRRSRNRSSACTPSLPAQSLLFVALRS